MRKNNQKKGIFCLEGVWENDFRIKSTVKPILDLLEAYESIPAIYKDFATHEELEFYLKKWRQRTYDAYPILYIASHGQGEGVCLPNGTVSLNELGEILQDRCQNRIVVLGSCEILSIDKRHLKRFLDLTGSLAICGYKTEVDWLKATAFELLIMSEMQGNEFSGKGIEAIRDKLNDIGKAFKELEFRMVTNRE